MLCTSCFCSSKSLTTATLFMRCYKLVSNHNLATLTLPYFVSSPCARSSLHRDSGYFKIGTTVRLHLLVRSLVHSESESLCLLLCFRRFHSTLRRVFVTASSHPSRRFFPASRNIPFQFPPFDSFRSLAFKWPAFLRQMTVISNP